MNTNIKYELIPILHLKDGIAGGKDHHISIAVDIAKREGIHNSSLSIIRVDFVDTTLYQSANGIRDSVASSENEHLIIKGVSIDGDDVMAFICIIKNETTATIAPICITRKLHGTTRFSETIMGSVHVYNTYDLINILDDIDVYDILVDIFDNKSDIFKIEEAIITINKDEPV